MSMLQYKKTNISIFPRVKNEKHVVFVSLFEMDYLYQEVIGYSLIILGILFHFWRSMG